MRAALAGPLGDPVEHDAEQDDPERRRHAAPEDIPLRESRDHVEPERLGADEAAEDNHREDQHDALVGRDEEGPAVIS